MNTTPQTYNEAVAQLEEIVTTIEQGELDVDVLIQKTEQAVKLIEFCRTKLTSADEKVQSLLRTLQQEEDQKEPME